MTTTKKTANDKANEALGYFVRNSELPTGTPTSPDVAEAVENFDGSTAAENYLWSSLETAFSNAEGE